LIPSLTSLQVKAKSKSLLCILSSSSCDKFYFVIAIAIQVFQIWSPVGYWYEVFLNMFVFSLVCQ
jgi:hypothetical protein